jgi:hypothetical protein
LINNIVSILEELPGVLPIIEAHVLRIRRHGRIGGDVLMMAIVLAWTNELKGKRGAGLRGQDLIRRHLIEVQEEYGN